MRSRKGVKFAAYEFLEARYATPRAKLRIQWQREIQAQWRQEKAEKADSGI